MFKNMKTYKKKLLQTGVAGGSVLSTGLANAALSTGVTDSITATSADMVEAGGLLIGLAVVGLGLRWVKGMFF